MDDEGEDGVIIISCILVRVLILLLCLVEVAVYQRPGLGAGYGVQGFGGVCDLEAFAC